MTPEGVSERVCRSFDSFAERAERQEAGTSGWNGLRNELHDWIESIDPIVAFDGLFHVLETQQRYQYQWLAGELLQRAEIPCRLSLEEFVTRIAPVYNASAETVPSYLASVFGKSTVLETLGKQRVSLNDSRCRSSLDAMRYFLGEHPRDHRLD